MNLFTPFKQITRTDVHGNEYTTTVIDDKRLSLGELWDKLKQMQSEQPVRNDTGQYGAVSGEWVEAQAEKQLNNPNQ
jgi:hypothetical protein